MRATPLSSAARPRLAPARSTAAASREAPVSPPPPSPSPDGPTLCSSLRARHPAPAPRHLLPPADPLPPSADRPTAVAAVVPGRLWTLTAPFTPSPISSLSAENRMTVAVVGGGGDDGGARPASGGGGRPVSLALFNPLTPTPELLGALDAIRAEVGGSPEVAHIFIPSTSPEHWSGAASLATAFPSARVWAPPGFFSSGPGGGRIGGNLPGLKGLSAVLDAAAAEGRAAEVEFGGGAEATLLGGSVRAALFAGRGGFTELAFYVSRTILTADTAFGLDPRDLAATPGANGLDGALARLAGIYARLGCATWFVLKASPQAAQAYVSVIDGWRTSAEGVEWVVPAHLSAPWPGEALEGAFAFVRGK